MWQSAPPVASDDSAWPPGTALLQDLGVNQNKDVIRLIPTPTEDPNDPLNWKTWEKTLNYSLVLWYTLIVFAIIDVITPTWEPMHEELGFSFDILNDSYATGTAALCIGAFMFIPFSLKLGRRPIYIVSLVLQLGISIWAAELQTVADLILVNVLNCSFGSLAEVIVQMTVADVFFIHQRGMMNSLYVWATLIGSSLSPVASGYVTLGQGWRWVWWWMTILIGLSLILFLFLYEETMFTAPKIDAVSVTEVPGHGNEHEGVHTHEKSNNKQDGISGKVSEDANEKGQSLGSDNPVDPTFSNPMNQPARRKTYLERLPLWSHSEGSWTDYAYFSVQPLLILFTIPPIFYCALLFGIVSLTFQITVTTISTYMSGAPYNFDSAQIGLISGIPTFAGTTIGLLITGPMSDRLILFLSRRNKGIYEPEMRLWIALVFTPFVPAGLLMFGYGLEYGLNWPIVAGGLLILALGTAPISGSVLTYMTDSYTNTIASGMVGVILIRNLLATIFVVTLTPWIEHNGIGNVYLICSMMIIVILLSTVGMLKYGKRMRTLSISRYAAYSTRNMNVRSR